MRFLIDANMPRSIIALVASLGHEVEFARDIGLAAALCRDYRVALVGWCDCKGYSGCNGAFSAGRDVCREPRWAPRNCGTGSCALPASTGLSRVGELDEKARLELTPNPHPAAVETHTQQGISRKKSN